MIGCQKNWSKAYQAFTVIIEVAIRFVKNDTAKFTVCVALMSKAMYGRSRGVKVTARIAITKMVVTVRV